MAFGLLLLPFPVFRNHLLHAYSEEASSNSQTPLGDWLTDAHRCIDDLSIAHLTVDGIPSLQLDRHHPALDTRLQGTDRKPPWKIGLEIEQANTITLRRVLPLPAVINFPNRLVGWVQ
ncbi:hypothetical protein TWF696_008667 [Orbilia brochopaga]|uniref:Uncharacterized protein n=1 Tax=Orbilia brochopaga TaxID=3140254 RepID=A0AAV9UHE7_9PEZI